MQNHIENLKRLYNEQLSANRAFNEYVQKAKDATHYTEEYRASIISSLQEKHQQQTQSIRDELIKTVEDMRNKERTVIDLSDSRITNAVSLVLSLGDKMPAETLRSIENEFKGNQAALKALVGAYEKAGLSTTRIESFSYDVDTVYTQLAQDIYDSFRHPERLTEIGSIMASIKGLETNNTPEQMERAKIEVNTMPAMF